MAAKACAPPAGAIIDWTVRLAMLALFATACVDPRLERFRERTAMGLHIQDFGEEVLLIADDGNLAEAVAPAEAERVDGLVKLLVDERDLFGPDSLDPEMLTFEPAVAEQVVGFEGQRLASTMLVQTVDGAQVLESVQYGAWVVDGDGGDGHLRRVRAHLRDPSRLPTPPAAPDRAVLGDAVGTFFVWLEEREIFDGDIDVPGTVVISERLQEAGYLATWSRVEPQGGVSRLVAIMHAEDLDVTLFSYVPACHAGLEGAP